MFCECVTEFGSDLTGIERPSLVPVGTEVILRMTAAGVCHSDLHIHEGCYHLGRGRKLSFDQRGIRLPLVMGHEPAGVVVAAGPDAGPVDMSRNYVAYPWIGCGECVACREERENECSAPRCIGVHVDGAYATQIRVPHPRYLYDIGALDPTEAAPLACSGLTAFSALKKVQGTLDKAPILIIGAGGLGMIAIKLVLALGGKPPIVVDIDPVKREAALANGAGAAIDGSHPDAIVQIHAAAKGAPRTAIDFVGAESSAELAFDAIAKGGTIVMVGLFGGAAPWALPMLPIKAVTIIGSYTGTLAEFRELLGLAVEGKIPLLPTRKYPLTAANAVLAKLRRGEITGRAVLVPA